MILNGKSIHVPVTVTGLYRLHPAVDLFLLTFPDWTAFSIQQETIQKQQHP